MQYLRQSEYGVKFDWGLDGLKSLSSENEIMVIVDVLPSPNGSALSLEAIGKHIIAGCLRNFEAVADFVNHANMNVSIIAAGEKWPNGNIRYSIEDYLGAGAILSRIKGKISPEAEMAADAFEKNRESIHSPHLKRR